MESQMGPKVRSKLLAKIIYPLQGYKKCNLRKLSVRNVCKIFSFFSSVSHFTGTQSNMFDASLWTPPMPVAAIECSC